jgi:lysyl-tRNA synthetase class 2
VSFEAMVAETADFVRLFVGNVPASTITYREAILKYTGIDYCKVSEKELFQYLVSQQVVPYAGIETEGKDA